MKRWSFALVCVLIGGLTGAVVTSSALQGQAPAAKVVARDLVTFRDVVKQVLPAVVSVEVKSKPVTRPGAEKRRQPALDAPGIPEEFRRYFEEFNRRRSEGDEDSPGLGQGSGVIIDPKGVILTNYHVVAGAAQVEVTLKDGRKFASRDIKGDRKTDLAIVRVHSTTPLPALQLGDSDAMEIGDRVLAVGAPFGLAGSVTHGIISAKGRNLNLNMYEDFLQTDAAINPGNSGGPLVNMEGQVIGINSAIKTRTGGFQGVGMAISSNLAKNIMQQLQRDGVVRRGYLGVNIRDLSAEVADRLGVPSHRGVLVAAVLDGAPAGKAGIKDGDIITTIAGKSVRDGRELQRVVAGLPLGQKAEVTVVRDGKAVVIPVTIEEQPTDLGASRIPVPTTPRGERTESVNVGKLGVEMADLTAETAEQLGYKDGVKGALITRVEAGSVAAAGGLRRGMLIVKVDKQAVGSATAAREALEKAALDKGVLVQTLAPEGGTNFVVLRVDSGN